MVHETNMAVLINLLDCGAVRNTLITSVAYNSRSSFVTHVACQL